MGTAESTRPACTLLSSCFTLCVDPLIQEGPRHIAKLLPERFSPSSLLPAVGGGQGWVAGTLP